MIHSVSAGRYSSRPEAEPPPRVQMLYIQMEFCPRTLREVLDKGALSPEDCWQARNIPLTHV